LNDIKRRYGLIDEKTFTGVALRLRAARQILEEAKGSAQLSRTSIELANHGTMFGDDELKWPVPHRFRVGATLLRSLAAGLAAEVVHTAARLAGRYDCAPATCGAEFLAPPEGRHPPLRQGI
jgi:hypothetical protein